MNNADAIIAAVEQLDAAMWAQWGDRDALSGWAAAVCQPGLTFAGRSLIADPCASVPIAPKERGRPQRH